MRRFQEVSDVKTRLDGNDLKGMFGYAARLFERNVDAINSLNVYPVPDGDTGTNMYLTIKDVAGAAEASQVSSAGAVAEAMARAALYASKGNSGIILYQFLKGVAEGLRGQNNFGVAELASALENARALSYKAVPEPVEGTMLTVISSIAKAAQDGADADLGIIEALDAICEAAKETVALTPTMLTMLRDAGVVDAGGQGLSVIFEGARAYVRGEAIESLEFVAPEPIGVMKGAGRVSADFLDSIEHEIYGYCTNFVIEGISLDADGIRDEVAGLGHSLVIVGDETLVKIHIHAEDPGRVLSFAVAKGTIGQVNIQNMDEQHREFSEARGDDDDAEAQETLPIAIVAVAWGEGIEEIFRHDGHATIIRAGDTMNPSVRDVLNAIEDAPSEKVIVLPNNKNIVATANQAAELSSKDVRVVPTTSIPQGIAAILSFNSEAELDYNESAMLDVISTVRTGEICYAVRPVELNGVKVSEGQLIGLLDRELVVAGDDPNEVLISLLEKANVADGSLVTLYWGEPLQGDVAEQAREIIENSFGDAEVDVVRGLQPHYHYLVSIE